jgi:acyl carrier protein
VDTSRDEIVSWAQEYLAELLEVPVATIDPDADLDRLGVDSAIAVSLLMEVEERYGVELPPEVLFETPTLNEVATYLDSLAQDGVP